MQHPGARVDVLLLLLLLRLRERSPPAREELRPGRLDRRSLGARDRAQRMRLTRSAVRWPLFSPNFTIFWLFAGQQPPSTRRTRRRKYRLADSQDTVGEPWEYGPYDNWNPAPLARVHPNSSVLYKTACAHQAVRLQAQRGPSHGGFMARALLPWGERQRRALEGLDCKRRGPLLID